MNLNRKKICIALALAALMFVFGGSVFASEDEEVNAIENTLTEEIQPVDEEVTEPEQTDIQTVTIIGTVDDDYVLVSKQGVAYGIAETEAGDVMGQYVGEEVTVKGIISEVDDQKFISVTSFDFVEK
jgi:hypothetical protein